MVYVPYDLPNLDWIVYIPTRAAFFTPNFFPPKNFLRQNNFLRQKNLFSKQKKFYVKICPQFPPYHISPKCPIWVTAYTGFESTER